MSSPFLESPRFPGKPSFGFISAPRYSVNVVSMSSGIELRTGLWLRPLYRYTVTVGPRAQADIEAVVAFWHAVGGKLCGFRLFDYADNKSCSLAGTPSRTDQPLVSVAGSTTIFQMVKRYSAGAQSLDRNIVKPVSGTILIARDGTLQTSGFTTDYTTGVVTFGSSQAGHTLTWGGSFDVPVRFDNDELPVVIEDRQVHSVVFGLMELRL